MVVGVQLQNHHIYPARFGVEIMDGRGKTEANNGSVTSIIKLGSSQRFSP